MSKKINRIATDSFGANEKPVLINAKEAFRNQHYLRWAVEEPSLEEIAQLKEGVGVTVATPNRMIDLVIESRDGDILVGRDDETGGRITFHSDNIFEIDWPIKIA